MGRARINDEGFLERFTSGTHGNTKGSTYRDWFLVGYDKYGKKGEIKITTINLPRMYIGKRVKFKAIIVGRK